MSTSATVTYSVTETGAVFTYEVVLRNTSPAGFDAWSFFFAWQHDAQVAVPYPLANVVLVSAPAGWTGMSGPMVTWGTDWQGSAAASGYIPAAESGVFVFQSTTPPRGQLPFSCWFHDDSQNIWGFQYDGTANYDEHLVKTPSRVFAHINPLVLILGDELFARLNLPRPAAITSAVRDQLARQIRAMSAAERLTAAKTLDSHISALEKVREQLRTYEPAIANRHSID